METGRTVKSIVLSGWGGYDQIKVLDMPLAEPGKNEIEVTVNYCALNFADIYIRTGLISTMTPPFVLGIECSGKISGLGPQEDSEPRFKIGDRVVCYSVFGGLYREKVVVSKANCYLLPDEISLEEGAGIFVTYMTAYFSIIKLGNLQPGESILIHSCGGGVGWAATQLAKLMDNITVFGTASLFKHEFVKENGVDQVFEYENHIESVKTLSPTGIDLILENRAGLDFSTSRNLLKPLGRIIIIGANNMIENNKPISTFSRILTWMRMKYIPPAELINESRLVGGVNLNNLTKAIPDTVRQAFKHICNLIISRKLKPRIDSKWTFDDVINATKILGEGNNVGKVILVVKEEQF